MTESSPEDAASILSKATYSWVTPYLKLGASRPMQANDLPAVADGMLYLSPAFFLRFDDDTFMIHQ
jgi:hypothetical protein